MRVEKSEGIYGPTLQGEGINIGQVVSFVRFYGCDFRCTWCDTPFSLGKDKGGEFQVMDYRDILQRLEAIGCKNVVLSGGNPLVQPKEELDILVTNLKDSGYWIQVETQGSVHPSDVMLNKVDFWSLSPKLPSAGEMEWRNWKAIEYFINLSWNQRDFYPDHSQHIQFKFVIMDSADYEYLKVILREYGATFAGPIILQPEGQQLDSEFNYHAYADQLKKLHELVTKDWDFWKYYTVRVLPQYHKLIWQKERKV